MNWFRRSSSLELTVSLKYVGPRLIALSTNAAIFDLEVRQLLQHHGGKFLVWDFVTSNDERSLDPRKVENQALTIDFDETSPSLEQMFRVCHGVHYWQSLDPHNVAVFHSSQDEGGVERMAMVVVSFLLFCGHSTSHVDALYHYGDLNSFDYMAFIRPSDTRYYEYVEEILSSGDWPNSHSLVLHRLFLHPLPKFNHDKTGCAPGLEIRCGREILYRSAYQDIRAQRDETVPFPYINITVWGDVTISCYHYPTLDESEEEVEDSEDLPPVETLPRVLMFRHSFHVAFQQAGLVRFTKSEIDDVIVDPRFSDAFAIDCVFAEVPHSEHHCCLLGNDYGIVRDFIAHHVVVPKPNSVKLLKRMDFDEDTAMFSLQRSNNSIDGALQFLEDRLAEMEATEQDDEDPTGDGTSDTSTAETALLTDISEEDSVEQKSSKIQKGKALLQNFRNKKQRSQTNDDETATPSQPTTTSSADSETTPKNGSAKSRTKKRLPFAAASPPTAVLTDQVCTPGAPTSQLSTFNVASALPPELPSIPSPSTARRTPTSPSTSGASGGGGGGGSNAGVPAPPPPMGAGGGPPPPPGMMPPPPPPPSATHRKKKARFKLHWAKLPLHRVTNTIFSSSADLPSPSSAAASGGPPPPMMASRGFRNTKQFDMDELDALFCVAPQASKEKKSSEKSLGTSTLVSLLDIKRSNNVAISLSRIRIPLSDLRTAIVSGDLSVLDPDLIDTLLGILPTPDEVKLVQDYSGDVDLLDRPERFFLMVYTIPDVEALLKCCSVRHCFGERSESLLKAMAVCVNAVYEIRTSKRLQEFLEVVLSAGNFLNEGTCLGNAHGFSLDSLHKLNEVKSSRPQVTMLHFIVLHLRRTAPDVLAWPDDLPSISAAAAFDGGVDYFSSEVHSLLSSMDLVQRVTASAVAAAAAASPSTAVSEAESNARFASTMQHFCESAQPTLDTLKDTLHRLQNSCHQCALFVGEEVDKFRADGLFKSLANFVDTFQKVAESTE